jgi:hypothetical protein
VITPLLPHAFETATDDVDARRRAHAGAPYLLRDEYEFYDALTRYVEDQSIKAAADESARGRALTFTMAMLQR